CGEMNTTDKSGGHQANTAYADTFELTRSGREITGVTPIARFERLTEDLPDQADNTVSWSEKGELDSRGQHFLRVSVKAEPTLECQRCLKPFQWPVEAENRLQVVKSEAALEDEGVVDSDSDDLIERIVGSQRLDVLALVEDEIILSLPYVPKHDVCPSLPDALAQESGADTSRPNPFAALSQLKKD